MLASSLCDVPSVCVGQRCRAIRNASGRQRVTRPRIISGFPLDLRNSEVFFLLPLALEALSNSRLEAYFLSIVSK